ncbi:MAG TPA: malonic semialdehyde reductase [Tepidisphaeraceae bacterium]|jgi:3-hydroxypropanoate dehydrogenase
MTPSISEEALDTLFRKARTYSSFLPAPVSDDLLRAVYDLAKLGPTSANTMPMRVVFVKSPEAKERLKPALEGGNVGRATVAPVTAIIADDQKFYEHMPRLFPQGAGYKDFFAKPENAERAKIHAFRNATLQGAYLIIAARALGLDCGPMSGFNQAKVDAEFFPDGRFKSNFLINIGYGDKSKLHPRNPRLEFHESCKII